MVAINLTIGDNGIITRAYEAKYLTELSTCIEELQVFKYAKKLENNEFEPTSITSGENSLIYNTQEAGANGSIYDVLTSLRGTDFAGKMEIIRGELLLNSTDETEIRVAQELGIRVNPYLIVDGVLLSANTNLALMDENGSLTIPENVKAIGEGAFADLSGLTTIIIPGTVEEIRRNAFRNNADLENVILQEGVKSIGSNAFRDCSNIKHVDLPESLETLGGSSFYSCTSLKSIKIPSKIEVIPSHTFAGCTSLSEIILPEKLKIIDDRAFYNCNISEITLPSALTSIGNDAFGSNKDLTAIKIAEGNEIFEFDESRGMLMQNNSETQEKSIVFITDVALKSSTTLDIPEGVTSLNVILDGYNIQTVKIPSTLTSIEANDLPNVVSRIEVAENNETYITDNDCLYSNEKKNLVICYSKAETIEKTDLSQELEIIEARAFKQATNLKNIELPDSVLRIEVYAFINNAKIENITIGEKVEYIHPEFKYSNYSGQVKISDKNPNYTIENNVLYNKNKTELIAVLYEITGKYIVEDSVTKIGNYAFEYQQKMTEIKLPIKLKEISTGAFTYCIGLTEIYIPESVTTIGNTAFNGADNLNKIQINKEAGTITGSPWGATKGDRIVEWLK